MEVLFSAPFPQRMTHCILQVNKLIIQPSQNIIKSSVLLNEASLRLLYLAKSTVQAFADPWHQ